MNDAEILDGVILNTRRPELAPRSMNIVSAYIFAFYPDKTSKSTILVCPAAILICCADGSTVWSEPPEYMRTWLRVTGRGGGGGGGGPLGPPRRGRLI